MNIRSSLTLVFSCVALVGTMSFVRAMEPPKRPKGTDITFFVKFSAAGSTEIALAKIAQQKSKNRAVLSFASKMVADHTKADDKLAAIANAQAVSLPQVTSDNLARLQSQLGAASPKDFGTLYKADNVAGHEQALAILKTEIATGKDTALVAYAKSALPTVQRHARLVRMLPTTP